MYAKIVLGGGYQRPSEDVAGVLVANVRGGEEGWGAKNVVCGGINTHWRMCQGIWLRLCKRERRVGGC